MILRPKRDKTPCASSSSFGGDGTSVGKNYQTKLRPSSPMNNLINKLVTERMGDISSKVRLDSNSRKSASGLDIRDKSASASQPNTATIKPEEVKEGGSEISSVHDEPTKLQNFNVKNQQHKYGHVSKK